MQVLEYQTHPITSQQSTVLNQEKWIGLSQVNNQAPVNQIINTTIDMINQTIQQMVQTAQQQKSAQNSFSSLSFEDEWNFLYFIRLFFYILVILKIIELVFSKRKKMDIRERVYRKYLFSYAEMIREFNDDDRNIMNVTLNNTIQNASMDKNQPKMTKKTSNKKVIFHEIKNEYIEPPKRENNGNEIDPLSASQIFLSRPVKIQPIDQDVPEQVETSDKDFEEMEKIGQGKTMVRQENIIQMCLEKDGEQSTITQSTICENLIRQNQQIRVNEGSLSESEKKEKDL